MKQSNLAVNLLNNYTFNSRPDKDLNRLDANEIVNRLKLNGDQICKNDYKDEELLQDIFLLFISIIKRKFFDT